MGGRDEEEKEWVRRSCCSWSREKRAGRHILGLERCLVCLIGSLPPLERGQVPLMSLKRGAGANARTSASKVWDGGR